MLLQYHRIVGVGRDLCGSSSPTLLPKQGHLQQAAQDLVQVGLEYLQRRRLHNFPISLKSWNFALLKFRVLTMLFVIPISLRSISSTSAWSLQPRIPPILTSPTSSLTLVTTRSSIASPRVGVLFANNQIFC